MVRIKAALTEMTIASPIKALLAALLLATPAAQAVILDFEDFGGTNFQHGTVVNSQYDSAAFGNVTISAVNIGGGPDLAVAFDTSLSGTQDPDLEAPFSSSNPELSDIYRPGNVLIIQENSIGCDDGTCNSPDDEGTRPAGSLRFDFQQAVEILSLDFFDIENFAGNDEDSGQPGTEIRFFDDMANELFAGSYFVPGTGGDNTWDRLSFAGVTGVYSMQVNLYGSGAIDRLEYNVVPIPASVWLFGSALLGFIGFARRTSI